jgi:cytochrome c
MPKRKIAAMMLHRTFAPALIAATLMAIPTVQAGDAAAGAAVFKAQCVACHTVIPGKTLVGPSLFGIIGRKTGSVEGFRYSTGNKSADLIWNAETLDPYLVSPRTVIPGTFMTYAGLKDDTKRADLIAYLESLK